MLPKIEHPIFETTLPILQTKVKFRPLLVKEEKLLLLAKEANDLDVIINAMKQIVLNTVLEPKIDVDSLSMIDIQWLFVQLRIQSIGGTIRCSVTDPLDKKNYDIEVDLRQVKIKPESYPTKILLSDKLGLKMKLPGLKDVHNVAKFSNSFASLSFDLILSCIDSVFDDEQEYTNFSKGELVDFIDSLSTDQIEKLVEFFNNLPKIVINYSYTAEDGTVREWEVDKIRDFFT